MWTGYGASDRLSEYATPWERAANGAFLDRAFHVVVGNPPYITPKDAKKRDDYREFWPDSAAGKYALSAPFAERIFVLGTRGAFVGQITANSFMKRSFGKSLVSEALPKWDLTGIVDTSGAYIPGHGTPTVILYGRSRTAGTAPVWALLGKRGEPKKPASADRGLVWTAIRTAPLVDDDSNAFVTVAHLDRETLKKHPWSLGGGLSLDVKAAVEMSAGLRLHAACDAIGNLTKMIQDDVYFGYDPAAARDPECGTIELLEGEFIRDFDPGSAARVLYPYEFGTKTPLELRRTSHAYRHLWRFRELLWTRLGVGFKSVRERGQQFFEYPFYAAHTVRGLNRSASR
jgi:hypothetical protein